MFIAAAMLSHRHNSSFLVLLLILQGFAVASNGDDPPTATYHTETSEVRVIFFTTDDTNHPLTNINQDDFAIIDGEIVIREFRSLARSQETGLDVVVMVDASESVANRLQMTMHDVLQLVFQKQLTSDDNLSVVSFGGLQTVVLCTGDCRDSSQRLLSVKAADATPLFDALAYSATFLSRRFSPAVRPVLILFSDGDDTVSKISASDALQAVIESGALLYTIDVSNAGYDSHGSIVLQRMAEATGGRYFPNRQSAANVLQAAREDLRASYVVTYQLPGAVTGFHSLRILPKHNLNLKFHCRSGYYYGTDIP